MCLDLMWADKINRGSSQIIGGCISKGYASQKVVGLKMMFNSLEKLRENKRRKESEIVIQFGTEIETIIEEYQEFKEPIYVVYSREELEELVKYGFDVDIDKVYGDKE